MLGFAANGTDSVPVPPVQSESLKSMIQQEPVIQPEIKRRQVTEAQIDTENFEIGLFAGLLSIEDFGSKPVYGARLTYHITEDIFFEGTLGFSKLGQTSQEVFSKTLNFSDRKYSYYTGALGYNLLPGQAYIGRNTTFNTALYVVAGIGSTKVAGETRFTAMYGSGYRVVLKDWLALHANVRDYVYSIDVTGKQKKANTIEISLGATYFF
ncbi:MAG: outer membrane beta-barrel domain-containing protein [Gammaproteobacteria bacterium]|nr:outer membrane beta-barrel domain-containing protein [Gammaproteobacteria bacterium]